MPRAMPPFDLIARALAAFGQPRAAMELLELVVQRGGDEGTRAEPLLATLRARGDALLGAPGVRLDVDLVEAIATNGRLREALVVARAIDVGATVLGLEILHALELALSPPPSGDAAELLSAYHDALSGSAIAAQRLVLSPSASAELRQRSQLVLQLLRGYRALAAQPATEVLAVDPAVASIVAEMLTRRDLLWGRRALEGALELAGGRALYDAVHLLVAATDQVAHEDGPGGAATSPIQGDGVALLHIRMVNLEQAERTLRRICTEQPEDRLSPRLLSAVARLRTVQEASVDESRGADAAPKAAPPEWLNKRARRASVEGWAASAKRATPVQYEDAATSVLRPDDEAELHLRAGRPDKAVELYRRLAERFPDRPRFRERAEEIEKQMNARALMFADEMTVRRDLRPLAAAVVASGPPPSERPPARSSAPPVEQLAPAAPLVPATPAVPAAPVAPPAPVVPAAPRTVEMAMHFSAEEPIVDEESTDSSPIPPHAVEGVLGAGEGVTVRPIIGIG